VIASERTPAPGVDHAPVTIMQSRGKAAADAIWSVILGAVAVSAYNSNVSTSQGWNAVLIPLDVLAIVVCSLSAINCGFRIVRPRRVVLDSHGIVQKYLLRTHTIAWRDVDNFRACRVLPFWPSKLVMFDYLHPRAVHPMLRAISRRSGVGATLGPGWAMNADRLAALLSAARSRWVGSPQPA
jgi:hypothetical protein